MTLALAAGENGGLAVDDFDVQMHFDTCETLPPEADVAHTTVGPETTTPAQNYDKCDFQNGLCGWELFAPPPDHPFNWIRTTGKNLSDSGIDGPQTDHIDQPNSNYRSFDQDLYKMN